MGWSNDWLRRKYPTLEHLELAHKQPIKIDELKMFFEQNPNVHSFAIDADLLWTNRCLFLTGDMKLEQFAVYCHCFNCDVRPDMLVNLLNRLYERGFYQRLHLYTGSNFFDQIASVNALEKLFLQVYEIDSPLPALDSIEELGINCFISDKSSLEAIARDLTNLKRLYVEYISSIFDLFPFIRQSPKLKKIYINRKCINNRLFVDLWMLNRQRKQLTGACKLTIYADEDIYLAIKAATNKTNYSLIEIKRKSSYIWHNDFETKIKWIQVIQ